MYINKEPRLVDEVISVNPTTKKLMTKRGHVLDLHPSFTQYPAVGDYVLLPRSCRNGLNITWVGEESEP